MTAWRRAVELALESEDVARLTSIARSRTEPASRVERARMLLAYRENPSFFAVGRAFDVHHQTVQKASRRDHGQKGRCGPDHQSGTLISSFHGCAFIAGRLEEMLLVGRQVLNCARR